MGADNYSVSRNEDWRRSYELQRAGAPVDLAGAEFYMQARRVGAPLDLLAVASLNHGFYVVDAASGTFDLRIAQGAIASAPAGDYDYDILLVEASGAVSRIVSGVITLTDGVTQR